MSQRLEMVLVVHGMERKAGVERAEHRSDCIVAPLQRRTPAAKEEQPDRSAVRHVMAVSHRFVRFCAYFTKQAERHERAAPGEYHPERN
jgi:hypothetical protein